MFVVLIILWGIALTLLLTDWKNTYTRWAALTAIAAGGGGLSTTINEIVLPYINQHQISNQYIDSGLYYIQAIASFINQTVTPYCFLMFALTFSNLFSNRINSVLTYLLAIPIIVMIFITPFSPVLRLDFNILFYWCVPYIVGALSILGISHFQENNDAIRKTRFYTNLVVFPPMIFLVIANYTLKAFFVEFQETWRYMPVFIIILCLLFIIFGTKNGVLGVKLKLERHRLDSTMKVVSTGTALLNHSFKNELIKISMYTNNLKSLIPDPTPRMNENLQVILNATNQMQTMVDRIQEQAQDILLIEQPTQLTLLIKEGLDEMSEYLQKKQIRVENNITNEIIVKCDPIHVRELLDNVIDNAVESMETGGELVLEMFEGKKTITISIQDNGSGISSENLPYVFNPFFSTKNNAHNFGLGLSYGYNVMRKSGGTMEIKSELNQGTTVLLHFKKKKVQS